MGTVSHLPMNVLCRIFSATTQVFLHHASCNRTPNVSLTSSLHLQDLLLSQILKPSVNCYYFIILGSGQVSLLCDIVTVLGSVVFSLSLDDAISMMVFVLLVLHYKLVEFELIASLLQTLLIFRESSHKRVLLLKYKMKMHLQKSFSDGSVISQLQCCLWIFIFINSDRLKVNLPPPAFPLFHLYFHHIKGRQGVWHHTKKVSLFCITSHPNNIIDSIQYDY